MKYFLGFWNITASFNKKKKTYKVTLINMFLTVSVFFNIAWKPLSISFSISFNILLDLQSVKPFRFPPWQLFECSVCTICLPYWLVRKYFLIYRENTQAKISLKHTTLLFKNIPILMYKIGICASDVQKNAFLRSICYLGDV